MAKPTTSSLKRAGISFAALFAAMTLAGCGHVATMPEWGGDDMPPNYESRHPIELTGATESTNINVSVSGARLDSLQSRQVQAFGRAFRYDGEHVLSIGIPVGAPNERQAAEAAKQVRQILITQGLPAKAVVYRPYKAGPGASAPPLLLSYRRVKAGVLSSCGAIDSLDYDYRNLQYQDFGCSTQNNFAAQLANPDDLMRPRPMDEANAERRATVLENYVKSGNPPLTGGSATGSGGSSSSGSE